MTKEMFEEITAWQRKTFQEATALTSVAHLFEEVKELSEDLINGNSKVVYEYADCFLLLFGSAALHGMCYEDIIDAINEKMEINKKRQWDEVNKDGYVKHV